VSTYTDQEWTRKFGDEQTFALETTVRFGESIKVDPEVRQSAWVGGVAFKGETWFEFREAAQRTASVTQFNGQRRSRQCQDMDAREAFSMIWSTINGGEHPYFFDCLSAERLCPRLIPFADNGRFCVAIGTADYRLRFLYAEDERFRLSPVEVELTINDFEIPLVETMKFLESVAKLYDYNWRDVLWDNYRANW
jgi:hypothetical protein